MKKVMDLPGGTTLNVNKEPLTMTGRDETGIPDDWEYYRVKVTLPWWRFNTAFRKYPVAWIVEGTNSLQCLCPNCAYAKGYNRPIMQIGTYMQVLHCETCGTDFYGPSLSKPGDGPN